MCESDPLHCDCHEWFEPGKPPAVRPWKRAVVAERYPEVNGFEPGYQPTNPPPHDCEAAEAEIERLTALVNLTSTNKR